MEFGLDDEQEMIVQILRRFAERDLRGWAAEADRAGAPPERLHALGAELGCFLDAVPASDGGLLEGTYSHTTRALRGFELGRGCPGLAALLETNVEPALAVRTWGTVTNRAMVLLGEEALEPGHPVEKWYRDAKIYDIFEGTGQIQRRIIAKHLTGHNPT